MRPQGNAAQTRHAAALRNLAFASAAVLAAAFGSMTIAEAGCYDDIKASGVIKVGNGIMGLKPYLYKNDDGSLTGFEFDMLQDLTKRLGVKSEYVVTEWASLIPGLKSSRWDIIFSGMTVTQERIQGAKISFSQPYLIQYDVIVTRDDTGLKSMDDLKAELVASTIGTVDSINAHHLAEKGTIAGVADFNGLTDVYVALQKKQVNAIITDQITYNAQKASMPNLVVIGGPFPFLPKAGWEEAEAKSTYVAGGAAIGIRPECNDLLEAVNKHLADMNTDGTRQKIFEKYGLWDASQAKVTKN